MIANGQRKGVAMGDAMRFRSNVVWMGAVVALIVLSMVNVLLLSSCSSDDQAAQQQAEQAQSAESMNAEAQASASGESVTQTEGDMNEDSSEGARQSTSGDYLFLVNRDEENAIPDGWLDSIELVEVENQLGETYTVERKTAEAYEAARDELEEEGIHACLNSAYRSRETQESIYAEQAESFGEQYAADHVAPGGHSEHETGIAIDVILIVDGEELRSIEQMEAHPEELEELDRIMAKHGFILRYLDGKEDITGYDPELWHFRYLDDPEVAQEIMSQGITLEEYLGKA